MKVRMLRTKAITPEMIRQGEKQLIEGQEYDLDTEEAKILIEKGLAEPTTERTAAKVAQEREAAEPKGVETRSELTGPERQMPPHQTPEPPKSKGK